MRNNGNNVQPCFHESVRKARNSKDIFTLAVKTSKSDD